MRRAGCFLLAALMLGATPALSQSELRVGLRGDPGSLDPATNATFIGRQSLQSICDKLVDIDTSGTVIPMLAKSWEWSGDGKVLTMQLEEGVLFHDLTPFNAEAVKINIERYKTMEGSRRRAELTAIESVDVIDEHTVQFTLNSPSVALLTQMTDRASMMVSPKAIAELTADQLANGPVCTGPYKVAEFRQLETLSLTRFEEHWRADQFHFDKVAFLPFPDSNVRIINLRSGELDLVENVPPAQLTPIEADSALATYVGSQPAFEQIQLNIAGPGANPAIAQYPQVRRAISLAIDREALNQVLFEGRYAPGNQMFPPDNFWANQAYLPAKRDLEGAKALLAEVGLESVTVTLLTQSVTERIQVAEVLQAMLAEAGIKLEILTMEAVSSQQMTAEGTYEAFIGGSGGRVDPDLNISLFVSCGTANNHGGYCNEEVDRLLAEGRQIEDRDARKVIYDQIIDILMEDMPVIYLYNPRSAFASTARLKGFEPFPDGIIRLAGVSME